MIAMSITSVATEDQIQHDYQMDCSLEWIKWYMQCRQKQEPPRRTRTSMDMSMNMSMKQSDGSQPKISIHDSNRPTLQQHGARNPGSPNASPTKPGARRYRSKPAPPAVPKERTTLDFDNMIFTSITIADEVLTTESAATIIRFVRMHSHTLNKLRMRRCTGIPDLLLTSLLAMPSVSGIRTLELSFDTQQDGALLERCFQALGLALQVNASLRELVIRLSHPHRHSETFPLSIASALALTAGLTHTSHLQSLVVAHCSIAGPSAVRALADGLRRNVSLRSVDFTKLCTASGGPLPDDDVAILMKGLQPIPQLQRLRISECQVLTQCAAAIAPILTHALQELRIVNAIHTPNERIIDLSHFIVPFTCTTTLHTIEFYNCGLDDVSMIYLSKGLQHNRTIRRICLAFNQQITRPPVAFGDTVQHLDLFACDDRHLHHILPKYQDQLQCNTTMQQILLESKWYRKYPMLQYYLGLNRAGRRLMTCSDALGLWAHVLGRSSHQPDALFYFLTQMPQLVRNGSSRIE